MIINNNKHMIVKKQCKRAIIYATFLSIKSINAVPDGFIISSHIFTKSSTRLLAQEQFFKILINLKILITLANLNAKIPNIILFVCPMFYWVFTLTLTPIVIPFLL